MRILAIDASKTEEPDNVRALIDALKDFPQDMPVYVKTGSGEYPIKSNELRVDEK